MVKNLQQIMSGDVTYAAVRLWSEELSEPEAVAVRNRAQNDPQYQTQLDGLLSTYAKIEPLGHDRAIEAIARDYPRLLREHRRRNLALGLAAVFLAALGAVVAVFLPGKGDRALPMHFTRIGEQLTIDLADGSVLTLNTSGELTVDYSDAARRILLERGEAYFEVVEDPDRPFTVDLGTHKVTAVGTAFNVRKDPDRYQVAVTKGAVAFHEDTAGQPEPGATIEAGWVAEFDTGGAPLGAFQPESMQRYVSWRSGILSFNREPLYRVVQELNRYTRHKILIEDPSIQELKVFLSVGIHDIDTALRALQGVLPIQVTRHYDRIVITASTKDDEQRR